MTVDTAQTDAIRRRGFTVINDFLSKDSCAELCRIARAYFRRGKLKPAGPGQFAGYALHEFEGRALDFAPEVSVIVGEEVAPTFSYLRIYLRGSELKPHTDRPACEFTLSVMLDSAHGNGSALTLRAFDHSDVSVLLGRGDAVLFQGSRMRHWRAPLDHEWQIQILFSYVSLSGPFMSYAYDGRA